MQSASGIPSSHLWALSCPADQRGVGHGSDHRANPGTNRLSPLRESCRRQEAPDRYHERKRDTPFSGTPHGAHSPTERPEQQVQAISRCRNGLGDVASECVGHMKHIIDRHGTGAANLLDVGEHAARIHG
jgi:hypothetical protein